VVCRDGRVGTDDAVTEVIVDMPVAQLVVIAAFYLLIFWVGVYAGRRQRGNDTSEGLLLARRGLPLWIGALTMTATWVGGGYINGTAEEVYNPDRGLFWTLAPVGYALSLLLGGLCFARRMRGSGFTTLLDPFERRYGKSVAAGLILPALVGELFWSAAILVALGTTFATILGFDTRTSILLSAAIAIGYTMVGGLWSVAYTDVVQLICILVGLCLAIPFAVAAAGGAEAVVNKYVTTMPEFPRGNVVWEWLDLALLLTLGGIPWLVYFQRVLSSRDETTAVRLSLVAAAGCFLMAIPPMIIGAAGAVAQWPIDSMPPGSFEAGTLTQPALVLPYVLQYLTPPVVATIGLGAVAAAVMSSVDSSILSGSSMFAWNVYRPLLRPSSSDRELRWVLRGGVLVFGALATWLALVATSVYALWSLCADFVYVILFPQLVMVLFSRTANRIGAVTGAVVGLTVRLAAGESVLGIPAMIPFAEFHIPYRTLAMLSSLVTIWLVSRATGALDRPLTNHSQMTSRL
jgi:high affinity choline transporter 7